MNLTTLKERPAVSAESTLSKRYTQLDALLKQLQQKTLPQTVVEGVNQHIEELNASNATEAGLSKLVKNVQTSILKLVEKEAKIVPRNYYRNIWLAIGMSAFGLPLGVAFGLSIGNMGLMALGLPIGMVIGISLGTSMDKKAFNEGRQLDIEIRY